MKKVGGNFFLLQTRSYTINSSRRLGNYRYELLDLLGELSLILMFTIGFDECFTERRDLCTFNMTHIMREAQPHMYRMFWSRRLL